MSNARQLLRVILAAVAFVALGGDGGGAGRGVAFVEGAGDLRVNFGTYHKAGSFLLLQLSQVAQRLGYCPSVAFDFHFDYSQNHHKRECNVMIRRSPIEMVLSGYQYHRVTTRPGELKWLNLTVPYLGMSYRKFVVTAPTEDGLHMETQRAIFPRNTLLGRDKEVGTASMMVHSYLDSKSSPKSLSLCLEDFEADFSRSLRRVESFVKGCPSSGCPKETKWDLGAFKDVDIMDGDMETMDTLSEHVTDHGLKRTELLEILKNGPYWCQLLMLDEIVGCGTRNVKDRKSQLEQCEEQLGAKGLEGAEKDQRMPHYEYISSGAVVDRRREQQQQQPPWTITKRHDGAQRQP